MRISRKVSIGRRGRAVDRAVAWPARMFLIALGNAHRRQCRSRNPDRTSPVDGAARVGAGQAGHDGRPYRRGDGERGLLDLPAARQRAGAVRHPRPQQGSGPRHSAGDRGRGWSARSPPRGGSSIWPRPARIRHSLIARKPARTGFTASPGFRSSFASAVSASLRSSMPIHALMPMSRSRRCRRSQWSFPN